jgi:hypothetical protein
MGFPLVWLAAMVNNLLTRLWDIRCFTGTGLGRRVKLYAYKKREMLPMGCFYHCPLGTLSNGVERLPELLPCIVEKAPNMWNSM